jgi:hypothetical protein
VWSTDCANAGEAMLATAIAATSANFDFINMVYLLNYHQRRDALVLQEIGTPVVITDGHLANRLFANSKQ